MKFLLVVITLIFAMSLGGNAETKKLTSPIEVQLLADQSSPCTDMVMLDEAQQIELKSHAETWYRQASSPAVICAGVLPDAIPEGVIWLLAGMLVTWLLGRLDIIKFKSAVTKAEGFNEQSIIVLNNLKQTLEKLNLPGAAKFVDELDDIPIEMRDVFKRLRVEILDGDVSVSDLKLFFKENKDVYREIKELVAKKKETTE